METPIQFNQRRRDLIAENIMRRLGETGLSQNRLSKMVSATPKQVWDWVHARHAPSDRYLRRMEKVLEVERGYFTTEHGEEQAA